MFPTTGILDTFSGTLASWTTPTYGDNALTIASGLLLSSAAGYGGGVWTSAFNADQECFVTVTTLPAAGGVVWVHCRTTDNTGATVTSYHVRYVADTGAWALRKWLSGSQTTLTSGTQVLSAGDAIGISAIGTTITAYRKPSEGSWGVLGSPQTDSSITSSGQIGVEMSDNTARMDGFGGGNYVEGPAGILVMDKSLFPKPKLRVAA